MLTQIDDAGPRDAARSRSRNPFTSSSIGGRLLSGLQLPFFLLRPPSGYGVIRTVGRRTGKTRSRCVRVVRHGEQACVVSIHGRNVGWLRNMSADPHVSVRIAGGWRSAVAEIVDDAVPSALGTAYRHDVGWFCYPEYLMWRRGRPSVAGIRQLHQTWLETGTPVILHLEPAELRSKRAN